MAIIISDERYTVILGADNKLFLRTKRRHVQFESYKKLYDWSKIDRRDILPDKSIKEQEEDGLLQAFRDYITWYENRKSRVKIHLRMVAKLLYWHKLSVEKLWNPADPVNIPRINEMFLHGV